MRTNVSGIWAIGDCIGDPRAPKLAHVASTQGEVAVDVILGEDSKMDYDVVPNVVYTHPEVATVGLTEAQAKEKYPDAKSSRFSFKASGRALALGESDGLMKLVTAGPDPVADHTFSRVAQGFPAVVGREVKLSWPSEL